MAWRRCFRRCHQLATSASLRRSLATSRPFSPLRLPPSSSSPLAVRSGFRLEWRNDSLRGACGGGDSRRGLSSQISAEVPPGATVEVPLAQTGEGIAECELLKWFVQEGDTIEEFQKLCEVQSDKATIEITSRYSGKIQQILFSPGEIVKVGEALLKIFVEDNATTPRSDVELPDTSMNSELQECQVTEEKIAQGVLSTPSVRHFAKQHGINISDVHGTGKSGRVLKEDVLKFLEGKGNWEESPPYSSHEENEMLKGEASHMGTGDDVYYEDKTVPLRGFYRSMVKSMTMAAKVPHFHYVEEINCNALVKLKVAFQKGNTDPSVKHTYLPFLIKSLSMALDKFPMLNSTFREESNEVIFKGYHNVGIAMATPYGLVVPNIKKVQKLSTLEITRELSRLQHLALNNKLCTEDVSGGTITLSNIGAVGGKFGCPLINLPEVAIIAIGRIQKLPRYGDDGTVYPASIANVAVGADHRVVDGATVARFCTEWKLLIEKPELLFVHMK